MFPKCSRGHSYATLKGGIFLPTYFVKKLLSIPGCTETHDPDADADFPDDYHKEWRDDDDTISNSISSDNDKKLFGIFLVILIIIMFILW